jgi:hypothetical protein
LSQERLPFTATYFGSIGLTLYFAVGVRFPPPPPSSHHISLPCTITHGSLITTVASLIINPTIMLRNHREYSVLTNRVDCFPIRTSDHPFPPRLPYSELASPPTLTLFSLLLAPKCTSHARLVDHPARRTRLVPCLLLPHGLSRPALRCALWWKPANRLDERLMQLHVCAQGLCKNLVIRLTCERMMEDSIWNERERTQRHLCVSVRVCRI